MKLHVQSQLSWLAVFVGIAVVIGGCFYSIALRNPGGPAVSRQEEQAAIKLAYVTCSIGAGIAIGIPVLLLMSRRRQSSQEETEASSR